jgi:4-hydroxy-tetrahydrodipicolinate synthase
MMNEKLPGGLWPVMLTPFKTNGAIDFRALHELVEFYLKNGAKGLFANCLSSEMYLLSEVERIELTREVVRIVNDRVPVISTGTFGGPLASQVEFISRIYDTGVKAVIVITSQLVDPEDDDEKLLEKLIQLTELTSPVPLGTYECPYPFKRLLSPEIVSKLADTGRFLFHKDTSCHIDNITAKLNVSRGTNFGFFNANTPTTLASLKSGADGVCPIAANFYPELFSILCDNYNNKELTVEIDRLQKQLSLYDAIARIKYLKSAKIFLQKRGLKIDDYCRTSQIGPTYDEILILNSLLIDFSEFMNNYKLKI